MVIVGFVDYWSRVNWVSVDSDVSIVVLNICAPWSTVEVVSDDLLEYGAVVFKSRGCITI